METNDSISVENYRKLLRRAAWRLQYKARTQHVKECYLLFESQVHDNGFEAEILSNIYVKELFGSIPWERCRYIMKRIIIDGMTEQEVARELNMTQQGVNKWKKKGLNLLRQVLTDSYK